MRLILLIGSSLAEYLKLFTDDKEFTYIPRHMNWTESASSCFEIGGELALIENEAEDNQIGNFLCSAHLGCKNWNLLGGVWLGYYLEQSGQYKMRTSNGVYVNDQEYQNTDKTWSIPAYDYDYDLVKKDESSVLGTGKIVI